MTRTTRTNANDANERERRALARCFLFSSLPSLPSFASFVIVLSLVLLLSPTGRAQASADSPTVIAAINEAFRAAYNLDHEPAVAAARRAVALGPESSRAHRALASILWLHMLFQRGAVSVDHYLGSISRSQASLPKPDPVAAEEFKRIIGRAIDLANARLKANPRDVQAKFDAGAAYGIQASFVASVEGSVMGAFGIARRAYNAQEEVLEKEPSRLGAGLIVGTYRYLVSTFNFGLRFVAYVAGIGGGKEKGIALLEAATRDPEARVDAQAALMLIYSREGRHSEVVRLARELSVEFPRNRLFVLEQGAAAIRAGRAAEADATLTRGLDMLRKDARPKVPGEEALWLYKRGLARLNQNLQAEAAQDLQSAMASSPAGWVRGRIHVELGKLADLAGKRAEAVASYRTGKSICASAADALCENEANRLIGKPFSFIK